MMPPLEKTCVKSGLNLIEERFRCKNEEVTLTGFYQINTRIKPE
jgi:hypothetical protein